MGVDGMRLDAIPYLCVREGTNNENLPETHAVLKRMRAAMDESYTGRMFLAEANQWPEDVREYFGDGDECHMAYNFPLMPRIFMAVALEDRYPIAEIMRQTPDIPENCQWAIFLRNHDELTLEMVTDRERDYMYRMYAHEPRMRVNVGIRRRLAPLLGNDVDRIKLMNSLLLSMPGSPIIYYGDEIGMGDNIYIGDRNGVRTPMQWSIDRNAGFSRADPQRLYLPVIMDPIYGYQSVNVEAQSRDPSSLLNWTRRMLAVRRQFQCFGRGSLEFVRPQNRKIIAYVRSCGEEMILCVANLSQTAQSVELDLSKYKGRVPVEMLGRNTFPPVGDLPYFLTLPAHGFFWLQLSDSAPPPAWHVERLPATELPVLVLTEGLATFLADAGKPANGGLMRRTLQQLENEVLPEFIGARGWFSKVRGAIASVRLGTRSLWRYEQRSYLLTFTEVDGGNAGRGRYFLPLTVSWEDGVDPVLKTAEWTLAKVREHARAGVIIDAFADPLFCLGLIQCMGNGTSVPFAGSELRFEAHAPLPSLPAPDLQNVRHVGAEPTNTNVVIDEVLFLKAYRRAESGPNPDLEMTRFLTDAGFKAIAPLIGDLQWRDEEANAAGGAVLLCRQPRRRVHVYAQPLGALRRQHFFAGCGQPGAAAHLVHDADANARPSDWRNARAAGECERRDLRGRTDSHPGSVALVQRGAVRRRCDFPHRAAAIANAPGSDPRSRRATDRPARTVVRADSRADGGSHRWLAHARARQPAPGQDPAGRRRLPDHRVRRRHLVADRRASPEGFPAARCGVGAHFVSVRAHRCVGACARRPARVARSLQAELAEWLLLTTRAFMQGYQRGIGDTRVLPADEVRMQRLLKLFLVIRSVHALRNELARRPEMVASGDRRSSLWLVSDQKLSVV